MTRVFTARNPLEAHVVVGMLEASGIPAEVRGDALWSARGELPVTADTLPTVWVLDDDRLSEARGVVQDYVTRPPAAPGRPWRCRVCNEEIEPQFSHCWKCNAPG